MIRPNCEKDPSCNVEDSFKKFLDVVTSVNDMKLLTYKQSNAGNLQR